MQVTVTGRKMEMTEALKNHIDDKIAGIKKFLNGARDAHVVLSVEKHRHFAEIILNASGYVIHCKEETDNMYNSIDRVVEKLRKQLKKHKNKISSAKNRKRLADDEPLKFRSDILAHDEVKEALKNPQIIKAKNFDAKPMFLDEASIQINATKKSFLVFRNASNDNINVLYARNDGNLGLIDIKQ